MDGGGGPPLCIPDIPATSQSERKRRRRKECCSFFLFDLLMEVKGQRSQSQRGPSGPSSHHDVAAAVQGQVIGA